MSTPADIPIIFLTAIDDTIDKVRAEDQLARVSTHLALRERLRKLGIRKNS